MKKILYLLGSFIIGMLAIAGITFIVDYSTDNKLSNWFEEITCKHEYENGICTECGKNTRMSLAFEKDTEFTGKIMFDTSKTTEEVVAVMEELDYTLLEKNLAGELYSILVFATEMEYEENLVNVGITFNKAVSDDGIVYAIVFIMLDADTNATISSFNVFQSFEDDGFIGWNPDITISDEVVSSTIYAVGTEFTLDERTLPVAETQDGFIELIYLVECEEDSTTSTDSTTDSETTTDTTTGTTTTE